MPDVFISYAREDRDSAQVLAGAIEARGWSVWWDRKVVAGATFDHAIEEQLQAAKSIVVLWSKHSIASEWVRNEAAIASERDVLIPVLIDDVKQPLEFRRRQAADLTRWSADTADAEFESLCDGIAVKTRVPPARQPPKATVASKPVWRRWPAAAIGLTALLAGVAAYVTWISVSGDRSQAGDIPGIDRLRVVTPSGDIRGPDNPLPLTLGTVSKISLAKNQTYYALLSEPIRDAKVVLDMRLSDQRHSNLQSRLSVIDQDASVLTENLIRFNEIDVGARKTATWSARQERRIGFKLLNEGPLADFWLSVRSQPAPKLVAFFGTVVPQPLSLDQDKNGVLDDNEDAYYVVALSPGKYTLVVDFANAEGRNTNIQGAVFVLDADGGNGQKIISFNEIDVSYRKIRQLEVRKDAPIIINVENTSKPVRYNLKLKKAL